MLLQVAQGGDYSKKKMRAVMTVTKVETAGLEVRRQQVGGEDLKHSTLLAFIILSCLGLNAESPLTSHCPQESSYSSA